MLAFAGHVIFQCLLCLYRQLLARRIEFLFQRVELELEFCSLKLLFCCFEFVLETGYLRFVELGT